MASRPMLWNKARRDRGRSCQRHGERRGQRPAPGGTWPTHRNHVAGFAKNSVVDFAVTPNSGESAYDVLHRGQFPWGTVIRNATDPNMLSPQRPIPP
jgi:hypothetical protein